MQQKKGCRGDTSHRIYLLNPCVPSLSESAGLRVELGEFAQRGTQLSSQERVLLTELLHGHVQLRESMRAVLQLLTQSLDGNKHQEMIFILNNCSLTGVYRLVQSQMGVDSAFSLCASSGIVLKIQCLVQN